MLKRRLTIERRRLEENRHLMGSGFERAVKLIGEARQVGLIDSSTQVDYQNYQEVFSLLQDTLNWSPQMVSSGSGMDRLTFLQSKLQEARNEYDEIGVSLDNARKFVGEASGYSSEAQHQKVRLESIGLFEHIDFDPGKCPLCSGTLENPLPSVEMIRTSIVNLDKSIANVTREQPKLRAFISTLEQERQKKQEEIRALEAEIDGIYQQEDERARLRDINARKGKVVGRISLWVESVQNDTESEQQEQVIRKIEKRVQEIDSILDTDSVDERKQSALSRIQEDMTKWAKELQLEHCDNPYRLDLNKVTMIPFGQGFRDMSPPTKELMRIVLEHRLNHGGHPVLRWNFDNAYVRTDPAGNLKLDKEKSTEKIDGAVALVMALDRAMKNQNGSDSVYNNRGLLLL